LLVLAMAKLEGMRPGTYIALATRKAR